MKNNILLLIVVSILLGGCNDSKNIVINEEIPKHTKNLKVDYVIDGDTFISNKKKYRLVLVDTPETVHPEKEVQPYGKEASSFTRNTLEGQTVKVEYDVQTHDKYGRKLVYVWLNDQNFNRLLVEKGYARVLAIPPNTRYLDDFKKLEHIAKRKKIGLWQYTNY